MIALSLGVALSEFSCLKTATTTITVTLHPKTKNSNAKIVTTALGVKFTNVLTGMGVLVTDFATQPHSSASVKKGGEEALVIVLFVCTVIVCINILASLSIFSQLLCYHRS